MGKAPFNGATVRDGVTVRKVFDCPATPKQAPGVHTTSAPQAAAHEPATASAPAPITHPPPETTLTVVLADACPVRDSTPRVRVSLSAQSIFPGAADDTMPAGLVQLVTAACCTSPRAWLQPRRRGTGAYLHCVQ